MSLLVVLVTVAVTVAGLLGIAAVMIIGWDRLVWLRRSYRAQIRLLWPYILLLGVVLVFNQAARRVIPDISWIIGLNLTGYIYAVEGGFVGWIQTFATPPLTAYFAFMYVYGYVFLLVFPLLAYAALKHTGYLQETIIAYAANYGIGLVFYTMFISFGPRNLIPDLVEGLLYTTYPQMHFLTSAVNVNTNVFPSLHTSLAVTAMLMAVRTREVYPLWAPVAVVFAVSIIISTMYLGIHWAVDVVAGIILAVVAVKIAVWYTERSRSGAPQQGAEDGVPERAV